MDFHPKKSLGQNFLTNQRIVEKIIAESGLTGRELVVEVGPGFGILTEALLKKARRVIAIEKDRGLFDVMTKLSNYKSNLELIHADALKINPPNESYCLIANIPYSITSPLLDHFIRDAYPNLPQRAVLLVQKEVAEKICAKPPRMNVLALHVQAFGNAKIVGRVSRGNFRPQPKVDSAIIRIEFPEKPKVSCDFKTFFDTIHRGFAHKRKMLRTTFPIASLVEAGIDPLRRPETLSLMEWQALASFLKPPRGEMAQK